MPNSLKPTIYLFILLIFNISIAQQIIVDNTLSPQSLIENTLGSECVQIDNVSSQVNGSDTGIGSFGYFERGTSNFPFENGFMLTTGDASSGGNTFNNDILNFGDSSWGRDGDLEAALGITGTLNATSIEFDFTSVSNMLQFNYIFASEEYFLNFPCEYTDSFVFLYREAGTNDPYTNLALIPNTNLPVNSINIHDAIEGFCTEQNSQYFEGYNVGDTNYNGRTTVLSAIAPIIPNVTYHIKLVIADQDFETYDSAVFIEANSFDPTVELGDNFSTCAESVLLNADISNSSATYDWFLDGNPIANATQPEYEVLTSGTYSVEINIPLGSDFCTISDSITIDLSNTQSASPMTNYELCDDLSNDGIETFNLNLKETEAVNSVVPGNYVVSYHNSLFNAENNISPISTNYTNTASPEVIFVRIEDIDTGCLAINQFELIVNPRPSIVTPPLMEVCDDDIIDGFTTIDLSENDAIITNGQPGLQVTYHYTQSDADTGLNPIPIPYVNTSQSDMVYVNVTTDAGCNSTTTLNISILNPPILDNSREYFIDACDQDYDGFANFDLTEVENEIVNGLTNVTITYHLTEDDALSGDNPIQNPTSFDNTVQTEQTIYIRVVDNTSGCPSIVPFEIHPNLLLTAPNFSITEVCDENNDGIESFNLNGVESAILGDIQDVDITFYETETDRDNGIGVIDTSVDYIPPSLPWTLYITLTSPTCTEVEDIILNAIQITEFPDLPQQTFCDDDQDGFTTINLTDYDSVVTQGQQDNFSVAYFESLSDAENFENPLPTIYTNNQNPFSLHARITSNANFCVDYSSFEVLVNEAPLTSAPNPIRICDDNADGVSTLNLEDSIPEITTSTSGLNFTFHNTFQDAEDGFNAIPNPSSYDTSSTVISVRIENTNTGCHSVETLEIIVNTLPDFPNITDYSFCELSSDNVGDFLLNSKDDEILNGQTDKEVLYFLSENDAMSGNNPIDKTINFENTSNPQTIYVRVQNLTDANCFGIDSFNLTVGSNPSFNEPSDVFDCDDASNDTFTTINLDDKTAQIVSDMNQSLSVTYYPTIDDFEQGTNGLTSGEFTNSTNPQEVYVEISNGSICTSTTSFIINVIPVPNVLEIQPFEDCDIDYDGSIMWDLTEAEINILDIRNDNVVVSYFDSVENAETDTDPIQNPESFVNTSNPQTVFVKVTNTDFNCPLILPIDLSVNLPPNFNDFESITICDNETNSYDITAVDSLILDGNVSTNVSYYANEQDAISENNPIITDYTYQSNSDIIYARLSNTETGCFFIYPFMLIVNDLPIANSPDNLMSCDNDFDAQLEFDLETQTASVLGTQDTTFLEVSYHESENNALENLNPLESPYRATDGQTLYARVTDTQTTCFSISQFEVEIYPLPLTDIPDQAICPENFPLRVDANTGFEDDQYLWSTGETSPEIEITEIGIYSVTVTTPNGCEITSEFNVIESEPAIIEVVETVDFSDPNNITITVSGIGDYVYQLDGGEPQDTGVFENVNLGYHILTIIDRNGCASVTREVLVIDAPKFMTPNNDGDFDTWHIIGVETLPGTVVSIFDRYGKLLKQLTHNSLGWDGTYNGNPMPATDYWWSAEVRGGDIEFTATGHFALRR